MQYIISKINFETPNCPYTLNEIHLQKMLYFLKILRKKFKKNINDAFSVAIIELM